jgi:hypothetical protein
VNEATFCPATYVPVLRWNSAGVVCSVAATDMLTPGTDEVVEPEELEEGEEESPVVCETEDPVVCPVLVGTAAFPCERDRLIAVIAAISAITHMKSTARRRAIALRLCLLDICAERRY